MHRTPNAPVGQLSPPAVLPTYHPPRTWRELVAMEPALADVERFVRSLAEGRTNRDWEAVKSCLANWVGRDARQLLGIFDSAPLTSDSSGSDCTFCQVAAAEYFQTPTKLGTLADLCRDCAHNHDSQPS